MKFKNIKLFRINIEDQVGDTIKKFTFKKQVPIMAYDDFDKICGKATNIRMSDDVLLADLNIDCRKFKKNNLRTAAPAIKDINAKIIKNKRIINSCKLMGIILCEYQTIRELDNNLNTVE